MKVLNKYKSGIPQGSVYIGRGSPYGNPFIIGKDGSREEVIKKFEDYLMTNKELLDLVKKELRGKDLVCFCSPKHCHGDVLIRVANQIDF